MNRNKYFYMKAEWGCWTVLYNNGRASSQLLPSWFSRLWLFSNIFFFFFINIYYSIWKSMLEEIWWRINNHSLIEPKFKLILAKGNDFLRKKISLDRNPKCSFFFTKWALWIRCDFNMTRRLNNQEGFHAIINKSLDL